MYDVIVIREAAVKETDNLKKTVLSDLLYFTES